jgi:hypothetical protein
LRFQMITDLFLLVFGRSSIYPSHLSHVASFTLRVKDGGDRHGGIDRMCSHSETFFHFLLQA